MNTVQCINYQNSILSNMHFCLTDQEKVLMGEFREKEIVLCLHVPFMHVIVEEHNSMTRTAKLPGSSAGTVKMET